MGLMFDFRCSRYRVIIVFYNTSCILNTFVSQKTEVFMGDEKKPSIWVEDLALNTARIAFGIWLTSNSPYDALSATR